MFGVDRRQLIMDRDLNLRAATCWAVLGLLLLPRAGSGSPTGSPGALGPLGHRPGLVLAALGRRV